MDTLRKRISFKTQKIILFECSQTLKNDIHEELDYSEIYEDQQFIPHPPPQKKN